MPAKYEQVTSSRAADSEDDCTPLSLVGDHVNGFDLAESNHTANTTTRQRVNNVAKSRNGNGESISRTHHPNPFRVQLHSEPSNALLVPGYGKSITLLEHDKHGCYHGNNYDLNWHCSPPPPPPPFPTGVQIPLKIEF